MSKIDRKILLNPGPATTTDTVKYAQIVSDICPREKEFGAVMEFISKSLVSLVGPPEKYAAVLFGGSGTAVVESMIVSSVGEDALLIVNNGAYGERMRQISVTYGIDHIVFNSSPVGPIDIDQLKATIQNCSKRISHLAVVHHETTTGLLSDIASIGKLCAEFGIKMIVDAVSSFAAIPIDMEKMNISMLASTSNKNLQGMAGVGFVIANRGDLLALSKRKPRSYYLDLYKQYEYFQKENQTRFTPPVQTLYALQQAIIETLEETVEGRYLRYSKSWGTLIEGLKRLNLDFLVRKENHAKLITAVVEPDIQSYSMNEMHDFFYSQGYTIYPGKITSMNTFRIANIGDINYNDMHGFILLLEEYLKLIKYI